MIADLVLKHGHIIDPSLGIDLVGDVAVKDGKILKIGKALALQTKQTLDAEGCIVTPGLIDIHAHIFDGGTWNGMPADLAAIPMGVTAILDAGSTGVSNYEALLKQLETQRIRSKIMLNTSACGIIMPTQFAEPVDASIWDIDLFDRVFRRYGERIVGLKLRINRGVVGQLGLKPLEDAIELATRYDTRVIAHVTDAPEPMGKVASLLRKDDVFCHVCHGTGHTIFNEDGMIQREIWEARERGVIFDASSGRGNFSLSVAKQAMEQGFLPDTVSSDVTLQNWHNPIAGQLPYVMTRWLALGMTVADIIQRSTFEPAKQLGIEGLGTLTEGTVADISVLKLEKKKTEFRDKFGTVVYGDAMFVPKATMIGGDIMYRAVDCPICY